MKILINILLAFNVIVSVLIVLIVLMQRPKNEGLGAAFGGGMTENLFGAQTTNVLATVTRWLGGVFFVLTLLLSFLYSRNFANSSSVLERLKNTPQAVTATPTPILPIGATPAPILEVPGAEGVPAPPAGDNSVTPPTGTPPPPIPGAPGAVSPSVLPPAPATPGDAAPPTTPGSSPAPAGAPAPASIPSSGTPAVPAPANPPK